MTAPAPDRSLESWDKRLETLGRIGPYVLLLISTLIAVLAGPRKDIWVTLGLVAFAAAWIAWWATLHPGWALRAVRAAARGDAVLSPSVATRLVGRMRAPVPASEPLSQRELEVLGLVAQGAGNREAAARLFISEATVKTHLMHIYAKLGVNDRAAAVAAAFDRGLLTPGAR